MRTYKAVPAAVVLLLIAFVCTAGAGIVWSNPSGSAGLFDWYSGSSTLGLYGNPVLIGNDTLTFFPSGLRAQSLGGTSDTTSDSFTVSLSAHSGFSFDSISIAVNGDYGILGSGEVSPAGSIQIRNLDTLEVVNASFVADSAVPIESGTGSWSGTINAAIPDADWTNIMLTLDSSLFASGSPSTAAYIEEKVLGSTVAMRVIPEPVTAVILGLGLLILSEKKRLKHQPTQRKQ